MTAIPSAAAFHRHLDACHQCRENPFALCLVCYALITKAAGPKPDIDPVPFVPPVAVVPPLMEGVE